METAIETIEVHGYTLNIYPDVDPVDPRAEFNNIFKLYCFRARMTDLGDDHNFDNPEEFLESVEDRKDLFIIPVYIYEHGNILLKIKPDGEYLDYPFTCNWDSGLIGYMCIDSFDAIAHFDGTRDVGLLDGCVDGDGKACDVDKFPDRLKDALYNAARAELAEYTQYLNGEVYGYVVTNSDGESVDTCWGFYDYEYCKSSGIEAIPETPYVSKDEKIAEVVKYLRSIVSLAGNRPDEQLMTRTGANDAAARGILYVGARDYAKAALKILGVE